MQGRPRDFMKLVAFSLYGFHLKIIAFQHCSFVTGMPSREATIVHCSHS